MPKFVLLTQQGTFELLVKDGESVFDILKRSGIPSSMISLLIKHGGVDSHFPTSLMTKFSELNHDDVVFARITRNIDIASFIPKLILQKAKDYSTEWIESVEKKDGNISNILVQLNQKEAEASVVRAVQDFFKEFHSFGQSKIVVGASGGGDSNALLTALSAAVPAQNIIVVTLLGFPDWTESSVGRATLLCKQYNFKQIIVSAEDVARGCGFKVPLQDSIESFKSTFGHRELIFLSTFAIQQCLTLKAKELQIQDIILGANREDVLGESLYYISLGLLPSPFPVRSFGEHQFGFPLWLVPKKIIDGVHPKMSIENYSERDPGSTRWRDRFYFLAHLLEDSGIGADLLILKGLANLSKGNKEWLSKDERLSNFVVKDASEIGKTNWMNWLRTVSE